MLRKHVRPNLQLAVKVPVAAEFRPAPDGPRVGPLHRLARLSDREHVRDRVLLREGGGHLFTYDLSDAGAQVGAHDCASAHRMPIRLRTLTPSIVFDLLLMLFA